MIAQTSIEDLAIAQARAAAYGLIAGAFRYPAGGHVSSLTEPARWTAWPEVLRQLDTTTAERLDAARACLQAEADKLEDDAGATGLQESFNDLFGHAVRGKCPPYELEYGRSEINQQASTMADVAGFYSAFGMDIRAGFDDRHDHICVECEFMSVLCLKEAYAVEVADRDNIGICRDAQRSFLKDHLARWIVAFAYRVTQADPRGFYGAIARFTDAFVTAECRRFDIPTGLQTLELRPADPELDTNIQCGAVESCSGSTESELVQLDIDPAGGRQR